MKKVRISDQDYKTLELLGSVCLYDGFSVGSKKLVFSDSNKNALAVVCTQNCPINIKLIEK